MLFRLMHYVCSSVAVKRMQKQGYSPADFAAENQMNLGRDLPAIMQVASGLRRKPYFWL